MNLKEPNNYNIEDLLVIISILTLGIGDMGGNLPLNLSQFFILFLLGIITIRVFKKGKLEINKGIIFTFYYIVIVTFLLNQNGIESLKSFIILSIYIFVFYTYISGMKSFNKIISIIYNISFYISLIGVIQQIAFLYKIEPLYNYIYIGINNAITISGGFLRVTSLMTEPAHLSMFMVSGVSIMLLGYYNNLSITNKFKNIMILLCAFFTFSMVVYLAVLLVIIFTILLFSGNLRKKIIFIVGIVPLLLFLFFKYSDSLLIIKYKFESFFTLSVLDNNNLSSFAVISNFKIAIEKLKNGLIFGTGLDSHSKTYFEYIDSLYNGIVMYLNYEDAASLYIRILSEFGLFGFLIYVVFIVKMTILRSENINKSSILYLTNRVSLICVITYGIRLGTYTHPFYILMICLLIITHKKLRISGTKL